jgi:hypothetical protein
MGRVNPFIEQQAKEPGEGRREERNLDMADAAELVAFLHEVIAASGRRLLEVQGVEVVEMNGRVFYHGSDPLTVGGPFPSFSALLRAQGRRRHAEFAGPDDPEPLFEIVEWRGSFFRLSDEEGEEPVLVEEGSWSCNVREGHSGDGAASTNQTTESGGRI